MPRKKLTEEEEIARIVLSESNNSSFWYVYELVVKFFSPSLFKVGNASFKNSLVIVTNHIFIEVFANSF